MAFIAPLIVGAIGLTGVAATIGTIAIGTAITVGMGYAAARLLAPKAGTDTAAADYSTQLTLQMDTNAPRQLVFGKTAVGGSLVYWQFSGTSNNVVELVIVLNDWPSGNLTGIFVDGVRKTIDGSGQVEGYGANMVLTYYNGEFGQSADAGLISRSGGGWGSDHKLSGCAYVIVRMTKDAEKFPGGIPSMQFEIEGCKLYDPRNGAHVWGDVSTWAYSNNPAVIAYNWRVGFWRSGVHLYGMSTPASYILTSTYQTAANICDQLVTKADTTTEKRYTYNGIVDTAVDKKAPLTTFLQSCAGCELESRGFFSFFAGAAKAPVMTITDADVMAKSVLRYTGKKSGADLVNTITGSYSDPLSGYKMKQLPIRTSASDVSTDGSRKSIELQYPFVTSGTQAQRLMEIERRRARQQGELEITLRPRAIVLEPDDWVQLTIESRGWVNKLFRIMSITKKADSMVMVSMVEIASTVFDFTAGTDELTEANQLIVGSGAPTLSSLQGLSAVNIEVTAAGDVRRPGIAASWLPIVDETVTAIIFQYRIIGSVGDPLTKTVHDPRTTTYRWVDGVQGGVRYEVRANLVTVPVRTTSWTAWVQMTEDNTPQVVAVASTVLAPADLSAQEEFELSLATGLEGITGSYGDLVARQRAIEDALAEVMIREIRTGVIQENDIRTVQAIAGDASARVTQEIIARVVGDEALAASITSVSTTVAGNTASITSIQASVNGLYARWGVAIDVNGRIVGRINLDGSNQTSNFDVDVDTFRVGRTGSGGTLVPVFQIGNVDGVPRIVFRGDMYGDGSIIARHISVLTLSAIVADLGTITAGRMMSADGKVDFNLNSKYIIMDV